MLCMLIYFYDPCYVYTMFYDTHSYDGTMSWTNMYELFINKECFGGMMIITLLAFKGEALKS